MGGRQREIRRERGTGVATPAPDCGGSGASAGVSAPRVRPERGAPRGDLLQHSVGLAVRAASGGLRAGRAGGIRQNVRDGLDGDGLGGGRRLGVRASGVWADLGGHRSRRRLQLRRRAAGTGHWAETHWAVLSRPLRWQLGWLGSNSDPREARLQVLGCEAVELRR